MATISQPGFLAFLISLENLQIDYAHEARNQ
jgi:hypothetical protein